MSKKFRVGIVGGTGYVGQRFVTFLEGHPWFDVCAIAASPASAGKTYEEAVSGRWKMTQPIPENVKDLVVFGTDNLKRLADTVDFVFCAVDMEKAPLIELEENLAKLELPVVSNNSANRWTPDVPMIMPEVNSDHVRLIERQKKRLGTKRGFIAVKPNCSIQSYVPALTPLLDYGLQQIQVATYQAISGAGKSFADWPEMVENVIPYIGGEEEKSEQEPLRIWGTFDGESIKLFDSLKISAQCLRVAVQEGHTAAVWVKFKEKPDRDEILRRWKAFKALPQEANLPSAPQPFLTYFEDNTRPQPKLDVMAGRGWG